MLTLDYNNIFIGSKDSIVYNVEKAKGKVNDDLSVLGDSVVSKLRIKKQFIPNPTKATWLAIAFPGGGQIYNRKYWKLPLIYGGFAGCIYAFAWNTKTYKDYSQAYIDITDNNPDTKSYEDLLPRNSNYSINQLTETIRTRKNTFRRYRDLSIIAFVGVYVLSIVDAYVDAELSDFDISPDLSLNVKPILMNDGMNIAKSAVGMQCTFRF